MIKVHRINPVSSTRNERLKICRQGLEIDAANVSDSFGELGKDRLNV
jgi:hypothetical protein